MPGIISPKRSGKFPVNPLVGKWVPRDREVLIRWARNLFNKFVEENPKEYEKWLKYFPHTDSKEETLHQFAEVSLNIKKVGRELNLLPAVQDLVEKMGTDQDVGMLMVQMCAQVHQNMPLLGLVSFLFLLNKLIRFAPRFVEDDPDKQGWLAKRISIPVPLGCLLTNYMNTPAGFAGFLKTSEVNKAFRKILDDYGAWLKTPESRGSLNSTVLGGWFTEEALEAMPNFKTDFECSPGEDYWGYASFDAFFSRKLQPNARPIDGAGDASVIVNACENAPFQTIHNVKKLDVYWVKKQPYALQYIFGADPIADEFVGGTVFQGFLSPHTYHRFHAPVSGKVVMAKVIEGTYFSQPYYLDGSASYMDSQPYLGHVATRGVIVIDTEQKNLGKVAFVPIGMVDVSTVDLDLIKDKTRVTKGDNIGTFHFGGSSHLLIFQKHANLEFDYQGITPSPDGIEFLKVNTKIAKVVLPK